MIVAEQKPFEEILKSLEGFKEVAVAACGTCVTVCLAGGEKEAGELAAAIELQRGQSVDAANVKVVTLKRQCDIEFLDEAAEALESADIILSLGCGAGV